MQTKNALSNLRNRYIAVLKKCNLINTFGALAIATMCAMPTTAFAATNPEGITVESMTATLSDPILINKGTISGGNVFDIGIDINVGMFGFTSSSDSVDYSFTNMGTIILDKDASRGINAIAENGSHTLSNGGTITVSGADYIYGMNARAYNNGSHTVTNSGTLTVSGNNTLYGIYAKSSDGNHNLTNSGTLTVSGNSALYGMYVSGTNVDNGIHLLNNTGTIYASASIGKAYHGYGIDNYSVGTWAIAVRNMASNEFIFGSSGNKIDFSNASLYLRPGLVSEGFAWNAPMVLNLLDNSTVVGAVNLQTEVPFIQANIISPFDSTTGQATVSLSPNINDETTPTGATALANLNTILTQTGNVTKALSDLNDFFNVSSGLNMGSETADENKWLSFGKLYGSVGDNNKYSFNSKSAGITAGASYAFSNAFSAGFHFDYNYSENESDYINNDANSLALGLHSNYFVNPNWFVGGQLTGSYSMNDVEYNATSYLSAEDDYDSYALFARVNTGYHFAINNENVITPEIGLSYLYTNSDDYDFNFANLPMYNMAINNDSYSALYADFMLTWKGNYVQERSTLVPSLGLGVRQNLTGSDIDSAVNVLGSRFETTASSDDTTFLASAGLEWQRETFTFGAYYDGEYGSEQQNHTGSLKLTYKF